MKEYILSIVSVILLTAAVGIILPEGKTGKFIKGIFAVATLVVILTPLTKIGDYIPAFETESGDVEIGYDEEYLDYMYDKKSEVYAAEIESYIQEKGCESDVEIVYDCADYEFHIVKVSTNLYFSGISETKGLSLKNLLASFAPVRSSTSVRILEMGTMASTSS